MNPHEQNDQPEQHWLRAEQSGQSAADKLSAAITRRRIESELARADANRQHTEEPPPITALPPYVPEEGEVETILEDGTVLTTFADGSECIAYSAEATRRLVDQMVPELGHGS